MRKLYGSNFMHYVNERRLEYVKELLFGSEMSVTEIAQTVCFTSSNYFGRIFRNAEGVSPTSWRQMIEKKDKSSSCPFNDQT